MKFLLILVLFFYTVTWLTGIYMTRNDKVEEFKQKHLSLSLAT